MFQEKLDARASKSSGWLENVTLIMLAIRFEELKKGMFVDRIFSGIQ